MRLLSWMHNVKARSGIRMEDTRLWDPPVGQFPHPHPVQVMLLAPMDQHGPPEPHHPISEGMQAVRVSWYRVIVEVTLHDRLEPLAGERNRFMHAVAELLFDFLQFGPHPFAHCLALYHEVPVPVCPADVRESQKVERFRFAFPSLFPIRFGEAPELDPARLVRV